jgi:membrane protein YqaA with SNARE-associated domain
MQAAKGSPRAGRPIDSQGLERQPGWAAVAEEPVTKRVVEAGKFDEEPRRLYWVTAVATAGGALLWFAGWLLLRLQGNDPEAWNAVWLLAGVSFLSSVILPIPGITATLLLALSRHPLLGTFGVLGAALGSTLGAALLLGLGKEGRERLRKRATHSKWSRKTLEWSKALAKKWTYFGVAVLLVPQFIPKLVVLYAAVLVELRAIPFLAACFVGVFFRNLAVLGFFSLFPW